MKVTCFDGKHHSGRQLGDGVQDRGVASGLKEALAKAGPILLEPISELVVTVPEASQGDIMGDLNGKRGRIQGSASVGGGEVEIVATVPTSEILRYAIDLRSMTGGRGRFIVAPLALRPGARRTSSTRSSPSASTESQASSCRGCAAAGRGSRRARPSRTSAASLFASGC